MNDSKILKKFVEQAAWSSKSLRTFVSMSVDNLFILGFTAGLLGVISYADELSINIKTNYIVV